MTRFLLWGGLLVVLTGAAFLFPGLLAQLNRDPLPGPSPGMLSVGGGLIAFGIVAALVGYRNRRVAGMPVTVGLLVAGIACLLAFCAFKLGDNTLRPRGPIPLWILVVPTLALVLVGGLLGAQVWVWWTVRSLAALAFLMYLGVLATVPFADFKRGGAPLTWEGRVGIACLLLAISTLSAATFWSLGRPGTRSYFGLASEEGADQPGHDLDAADIEIRSDGSKGILPIFGGLLLGVGGWFIGTQVASAPDGSFDPYWLIPMALGLGLFLYGGYCLFDNRVRLTLTSEGLEDHRTGVTLRWRDVRALQLKWATYRGDLAYVTLHLQVFGTGGHGEVLVSVDHLDMSHDDIASLVEERCVAAREVRAAIPDEVIGVILEGVITDLASGMPLSGVACKLTRQGLDQDAAARVVSLVVAGRIARCDRCRLDYYATISTCGSCGARLSGPAGASTQGEKS